MGNTAGGPWHNPPDWTPKASSRLTSKGLSVQRNELLLRKRRELLPGLRCLLSGLDRQEMVLQLGQHMLRDPVLRQGAVLLKWAMLPTGVRRAVLSATAQRLTNV